MTSSLITVVLETSKDRFNIS